MWNTAKKKNIGSNSCFSPLMTSVPPDYPKKYSIHRCCGATTFISLQWDLRDNGQSYIHAWPCTSLRGCKTTEVAISVWEGPNKKSNKLESSMLSVMSLWQWDALCSQYSYDQLGTQQVKGQNCNIYSKWANDQRTNFCFRCPHKLVLLQDLNESHFHLHEGKPHSNAVTRAPPKGDVAESRPLCLLLRGEPEEGRERWREKQGEREERGLYLSGSNFSGSGQKFGL